MVSYEVVETDVLIVGGGGAGVRAAIEAASLGVSVAMVCKAPVGRGGLTPMACPSYQAAFAHEDPSDSRQVQFDDAVREGRRLGDENLIEALCAEAPERALDMERYGVKFKKRGEKFLQVLHAGQSYPRNLVIQAGGYGMIAGLRKELKRHQNVTLFEDVLVTKLLKGRSGVNGATAVDLKTNTFLVFQAKAVILATGGYEQLWKLTDTAPDSTGDGISLAWGVGAELVDMEMMLHYPTVLIYPDSISGTLVQYEGLVQDCYVGGKLLDGTGNNLIPPGPLPVRDVLTRIMLDAVQAGRRSEHGGVYIDISRSPKSREEIDSLLKTLEALPYNNLRDIGIDIFTEPLEVLPATHFTLGGVRINERAETSVPGLYAAGEVSGNLHGANRVSGNALAETQVFGARAGRFAAERAKLTGKDGFLDPSETEEEFRRLLGFLEPKSEGVRPLEVKKRIRQTMHDKVGADRCEPGLKEALELIKRVRAEDLPRVAVAAAGPFNNEWREAIELLNMAQISEVVATSALIRTESRGHHWRSDYPEMKDDWEKHVVLRAEGEKVVVHTPLVVRLG
jgi:fumarate reductase (CoM/CoB) subunit A